MTDFLAWDGSKIIGVQYESNMKFIKQAHCLASFWWTKHNFGRKEKFWARWKMKTQLVYLASVH